MYKAFLFDFDGTLVDTDNLFLGSLNEILPKYKIKEGTQQEYIEFHGTIGIIEERLKNFPEKERHILGEKLKKMTIINYDKKIAQGELKFLPGAVEFLERIKEIGLPSFIVTNKPHDMATKEICMMGLNKIINGHIGADIGYKMKPSPEMPLAAAKELGIEPQHCILIGDHTNDLLAASSAGMTSIILDRGRKLTHKSTCNPDLTVENLKELIDNITEIKHLKRFIENSRINFEKNR